MDNTDIRALFLEFFAKKSGSVKSGVSKESRHIKSDLSGQSAKSSGQKGEQNATNSSLASKAKQDSQISGHKVFDSMPLVPDDASLLFTNAGMVQFKDIFTGKIPTPTPPRATSSQLCIRAGGKHNDLENVGYTARHHTLFEMLGNFSFGDYFKREAIAFAWEFVTEVLKFDKSLLYVTVHQSDDEAYQLWQEHIAPERIKKMGDKDNFWQMGDSGPCGPCSEIYIDQGEQYFHSTEDYFGGEGDRFLEIWNLVFMQYEQKEGVRTPLPRPSIDTGMGLERVYALKEGKINNYDTSLFAPLMRKIENLTGLAYVRDDEILDSQNVADLMDCHESTNADSRNDNVICHTERSEVSQKSNRDISLNAQYDNEKSTSKHNAKIESLKAQASFRVIADHARSVAFLLAQGVNFDKEGRGYVLRRILRRAVRHGYLLGLKKPFLCEVVGAVCESMGGHYGYLLERKSAIMEQCRLEEARFFETIEAGMELFNAELAKLTQGDKSVKSSESESERKDSRKSVKETTRIFSGEVAFKLYDTYGFPLDLTQDMLRESGIEVDLSAFDKCMNEQKSRSKASWKGSGDEVKNGDFNALLSEFGENEFVGYENVSAEGKILALLDSVFKRVECLKKGESGWVMLDRTPFYPESGGPIGDKGVLKSPVNSEILTEVLDTKKFFGLNLSQVRVLQNLKAGDSLSANVDANARAEIAKHHSATHLLHLALRVILGSHIAQAGSLVEANRLRFDFSHPNALTAEQIDTIQDFVNSKIWEGNAQKCELMPIAEAKAKGACALFGEKYGEEVRVISFGESMELCGGIHTRSTADIGSFYITKESGVSSGVRRIEAVCGRAGYEYAKTALNEGKQARAELKSNNIIEAIAKLKQSAKMAKKGGLASGNVSAGGGANGGANGNLSPKNLQAEQVNGVTVIVQSVENVSIGELKEAVDTAKNAYGTNGVAIMLFGINEGRIDIVAGVKGIDFKKSGGLKAGAWVKQVAQILGGNGGGRDDFAQAGVKGSNALTIPIRDIISTARQIAQHNLN